MRTIMVLRRLQKPELWLHLHLLGVVAMKQFDKLTRQLCRTFRDHALRQ